MKNYILISFLFIFLTFLIACGEVAEKGDSASRLEMARKAVGIVGAQVLWSCAGEVNNFNSNGYMVATLQKEPKYGDTHLLVSEVNVEGKTAKQNSLISAPVTVVKSKAGGEKEEYFEAAKRGFTASKLGSYDLWSNEVNIPGVRIGGRTLTIDCANSVLK